MKNSLLKWMMLTLVTGPMVGLAEPLGPIVLPTGTGDAPDPTEIGDKPPPDPKDQGGIQPEQLTSVPAALGSAESGPILVPTGPWDPPDETSIGDPPPTDPKDPGNIRPETSFVV